MNSIEAALAAIESLEPREQFSYRKFAESYGCSYTTLRRRHQGISTSRAYQLLQNLALRQILGAFKRFPTKAMEIEEATLPVSLRAEKLCRQYAIRALAFAK
jgi:hypothetical protein